MSEFTKAYNLICKSNKIILTTHYHPDGDALGSICSLSLLLENLKKEYIAIVDNIPDNFLFIPGIQNLTKLNDLQQINIKDFDLIITLDFSEISRSPIYEYIKKAKKLNLQIINFDHHLNNEQFGSINIVNTKSSSTTYLIYKFFKTNKLSITSEIATAILTGILTDTDHLSNSNTTEQAIEACSDLILKGAQLYKITYNTKVNKDIEVMKLWGDVLSRLQINPKWNIAYTIITQQDLKKHNQPMEAIEGLPNFLNSLYGPKAVLVLREQEDGTIRGSLRTNRENINLEKLAKKLGGGGHKKASGFTIKGKLEKTETGWKII